MALLLGELVELEQGEGLFDVELVHRLPFLPTVGPGVPRQPAIFVQAQKPLASVGPDEFEFRVGHIFFSVVSCPPVRTDRRLQQEVGAAWR